MANVLINGTIINRADTEANWLSSTPVLAAGEIGVCTDQQYIRVGDGIKAWTDLKKFEANIVEDSLDSLSPKDALSARQGKVLSERIGDLSLLDTDNNTDLVSSINGVNDHKGHQIADSPLHGLRISNSILEYWDGTAWRSTGQKIEPATSLSDGLMSKSDKSKLDAIEDGATKTLVVDGLTSVSSMDALSANMGKALSDRITTLQNQLGDKSIWVGNQDTYNAIVKDPNTIYMVYE